MQPTHDDRQHELDRFKAEINLSEVAAAYGFDIDPKKSSPNSLAMGHPDGTKIILAMQGERWVYFSVSGDHSGSVIDFVQARQGVNLGEGRKLLRPWLDGMGSTTAPPRPTASRYVKRLESIEPDLDAVFDEYNAAEPVCGPHGYLTTARGIQGSVLASERFSRRIRINGYGSALFPHWNAEKRLCGFEIKGQDFTGFAPGGTMGLWSSAGFDDDQRMVIAETAIDALSVAHRAVQPGLGDGGERRGGRSGHQRHGVVLR